MIKIYTMEQHDQWDAVVRSFSSFDVYWLSGYVRAFQIHGDGEPMLVYVEAGDSRGINVVMKRDVANDKRFRNKIPTGLYFDLSTPYGYGGWLLEGKEISAILDSYNTWAIENGVVSEFVRFHPLIKNHEFCSSYYDVIRLGEVVHMDLSSPEVIWENITSKNRNVIRKALKNGMKIYNGRFPEVFEKFRTIYNTTMEKDNADDYYYFEEAFYTSVLEDIPQNAQIFWADKGGMVVAASIMLFANGWMNYHLSGSVKEYSSLAPTNLLIYYAALWGCANGYKSLYLGGGLGSGEDGLFKFKRAFYRGELNHFFIGKKVFDKKKYESLLSMRVSINNPDYFPQYRG